MNYTVYSASGRTGSWRLCQMISSSYKNFNATVTWNNPEDLLKKEKDFLNKHNNAIEIYVEDSIEDIESKLNIVLAYKHNDTKYISKNKAADVIQNYSEIRAIAAHYNIA